MPPKTHLDRFAVGLLVVLCAIWGVQQVAIKLANAGISPVLQAGLRSIGATVLVWAWAASRRVNVFDFRDGTLAPGLLAGLLFAGEFALIFGALEFTSASRGVIFLYTAPFFVALGAVWLLPQEAMRRAQWVGMALAFAGVVVLFGENLLLPGGDAWIGDLMMLAAALLWGATTLTVKVSALSRAVPEKTLLYQLAVSALALPFLSAGLGEPGIFAPTLQVWGSLLFQTVAVAGASYLGWFWLVRHYPATRLSSFSFLTPVFGVLAGGLLLGEPLTPPVFIALGLVGAGIWIANRPAKG
ncbi:EamA family transporter [Azoarcus indigens]|uniref:Drug/metabolite transporter (DMT)-like permease n=1 Tax=Azoarcus indigens TaxID=29545 RepID=A0A4R6DWJ3_9RHOO|nr:DMT family transporter [Azoarcus indigens]NMG67706.1 EamA family transporter [Azoarcus indigens]TDN49650.1 drug/metabolite transporter (DMT)-like permease [Azoarcus indigens]